MNTLHRNNNGLGVSKKVTENSGFNDGMAGLGYCFGGEAGFGVVDCRSHWLEVHLRVRDMESGRVT